MGEGLGLSVVVPAYNEQESIGGVIKELISLFESKGYNYDIIVVDDGSTDRTADIVSKTSARLFRHPSRKGYGSALKTGIRRAHQETIVIIDADGTYPVGAIAHLLGYMDRYDMVVGARINKGVKMQLIRRFAKWILRKIANYLTGAKIPDLNSGLRVFKKNTVIRFFNILPSGFSFTTTITLAMLTNGYFLHYVPIDYYSRAGKSKIRPIRDVSQFLFLIFKTVMYFNPLKVFLPVSGILFVTSIFVFFYSAFFMPRVMDAAVSIIFMSAVQVLAIGMLADLIDKRSQAMHIDAKKEEP